MLEEILYLLQEKLLTTVTSINRRSATVQCSPCKHPRYTLLGPGGRGERSGLSGRDLERRVYPLDSKSPILLHQNFSLEKIASEAHGRSSSSLSLNSSNVAIPNVLSQECISINQGKQKVTHACRTSALWWCA